MGIKMLIFFFIVDLKKIDLSCFVFVISFYGFEMEKKEDENVK